jgi:poly-gamma-glutamate capsule biosynthesis protein CapA/YwtB (metallophosphatase superfamily)
MSIGSKSYTDQNWISLVAAGDVEWSGTWVDEAPGSIFLDTGRTTRANGGWQPVPRFISPETLTVLRERDLDIVNRYQAFTERNRTTSEAQSGVTEDMVKAMWGGRKTHNLTFKSDTEWAKYPFRKVRDVFRAADIAFVNLETPLSDRAPRTGAFVTPTRFTAGLLDAGIKLVSIANNHMMDAQLWGLYDTLATLEAAEIHTVGAGKTLAHARRPYVLDKKGIRLAFLAYSQGENSGPSGFALPSRGGVAPLDPLLIEQDIQRIRDSVDHVILSFHWDLFQFDASRSFDLHPEAIAFAHQMIDAGADAILGHHSHVPRAVEYYKGKPILYSMGHLVFSYSVPAWVDNYVARLIITKDDIRRVEILPVAGRFEELSQPYFLEGGRAKEMLMHLQGISTDLGGVLTIQDGKGVLSAR